MGCLGSAPLSPERVPSRNARVWAQAAHQGRPKHVGQVRGTTIKVGRLHASPLQDLCVRAHGGAQIRGMGGLVTCLACARCKLTA